MNDIKTNTASSARHTEPRQTSFSDESNGLNVERLPQHIAVIMDGNGRWAKQRHMPRVAGHKKGIEAVREIVRCCGDLKIEYLTLFGFSTENWKRPHDEVSELMGFLRYYLKAEAAELHKNNVRLRVIGFRHRLEADIVKLIESLEEKTAHNTGLQLTVALDYGAQQEIVSMVQEIIEAGYKADEINEGLIAQHLMSKELPDPDLIIRTSGEYRLSNFLLLQSAYAELYFTETYWPDFRQEELEKALMDYATRERRKGGLCEEHDEN